MKVSEFWDSPIASRVRNRTALALLLDTLGTDDSAIFDLTFHARFAQRIFEVMRREGSDSEGFDRMQHSFRDAVEIVRETIRKAEALGFNLGSQFTELTPEGMVSLLGLVGDLAAVKDWMLEKGIGNESSRTTH